MTYEQRTNEYREYVDAALEEAFERYAETETYLSDEYVALAALEKTLSRLHDEAEARINIKAQTDGILGST